MTPGAPSTQETKRENTLKGSMTPVKIPVRLITPNVQSPPRAETAIAANVFRMRITMTSTMSPATIKPDITGEMVTP